MTKTLERKEEILSKALSLSSRLGLEALSIGKLAEEVGMSKSGLFAHFNSKEQLQIEVLRHAAQVFVNKVLRPALGVPAGVGRIEAYARHWLWWMQNELPGGCPFVAAMMEYDDRPGPVRDMVRRELGLLHQSLTRLAASAKEVGDFSPQADCEQFAFGFFSLYLGAHFQIRLLQAPQGVTLFQEGLNRLLRQFR